MTFSCDTNFEILSLIKHSICNFCFFLILLNYLYSIENITLNISWGKKARGPKYSYLNLWMNNSRKTLFFLKLIIHLVNFFSIISFLCPELLGTKQTIRPKHVALLKWNSWSSWEDEQWRKLYKKEIHVNLA